MMDKLPQKNIKVATALILDGEFLLLTKRFEPMLPEAHLKWELPGGKIEKDETAEQAIIREVKEEISLQVKPLELIPYIQTNVWRYPKHIQYTTILCYICEASNIGSEIIPPHEKSVSYKWIRIDRIDLEKCLRGIRNFIAWTAQKKYDLDLKKSDDYFYIRLEREKYFRKREYYILSNHLFESSIPNQLQLSFFSRHESGISFDFDNTKSSFLLTRTSGNYDTNPRIKIEEYLSLSTLKKRMLETLKAKLKQKYILSDSNIGRRSEEIIRFLSR